MTVPLNGMEAPRCQRHDLLWLTQPGWRAMLAAMPEREAVLEYWRQEEWPVTVRRRHPDLDRDLDPAREICAAITLPPDADGTRQTLALRVPLEHVERSAPPLTLKAARPALPPAWRDGYTELQRLAVGMDVRVAGPLAWQALTRLPCVTPSSTLDVLLRPVSQHQLQAGLALLSGPAHGLPLAGEIVFPSGDAVPWRDWISSREQRARVLVKSLAGVRMAEPDELLASLRRS